jgi:leucyl aminopeptidase
MNWESEVTITIERGDVLTTEAAVAVLLCVEGTPLPDAVAGLLPAGDFVGSPNQTRLLYPSDAATPERLLLVGLGGGDVDAERIRQSAATAVREVRSLRAESFTVGLHGDVGPDPTTVGEALAEGIELGAYRYLHHRTDRPESETFEVGAATVLVGDAVDEIGAGVASGRAIARGVVLARDLVNRPGEMKTPPRLADEAVALGARSGISVTVLDETELEAQGFGGILAVGKGSDSPPRFIVMEYGATLTDVPTVCLVGKGLTFDSGGLNIKPAEGMESMKNDMGGSAAVFGAMQVVADLQLPIHVVGLVPSAENMPSGRSYRPGDIITTLSGKTVEILNTDAEGRVILSDGLFYAQRYAPDAIVELSTLTGAVIIALGSIASGLMATDQALADQIIAAADLSGDRVWQLPLWDEYLDITKSDIADLKNHVGRPAGSIGAGAFLAAFVGDRPFAHLDIAGTAWLDAPKKPYHSKGGTGAGVRVVTQFLRTLAG